jgi:ABC-type phosphate/phosphonate transport system ATPase subunit
MNDNPGTGRSRPEALVGVIQVTKRYAAGGAPALDHVNLQIAAGEAVAVNPA